MAPVINADEEGDRIELRLAPVQQESHLAGPRGGGGWGDDFGKEEGVGGAWGSTAWGKGNHNGAGTYASFSWTVICPPVSTHEMFDCRKRDDL